jgi:hypothetical protein
VRLTATVAWKPPWTGKLGGSNILDRVQRHPVTHPDPEPIRHMSRAPGLQSSTCSRRPPLASPPPSRLPAAAARTSHYRRRILRLRPPRLCRVRRLPILLAVADFAASPSSWPSPHTLFHLAGEPGERWIYIHCQFKVGFSCDLHL